MADPAHPSIALNRFGLGARPDEAAPADPARWLTAQFDAYQARPAAIAALPGRRVVAGQLADYLEQSRALRQAQGRAAGRPRPVAAAMMAEQPTMAAGATMTEGAMIAPGMPKPGAAPEKIDPNDPVAKARQFARQQGRDSYMVAVGARATSALTAPAPFVERLVHFWANHFAVSADKVTVVGLSGLLEFEAIRPHVLGSFDDMLFAVERHPAMLLYLDQAQSIGPDSAFGQGVAMRAARRPGNAANRVGLNENLAREILELHTLGVRTGYAQADVTEFARAMTGWTVAGLGRGPASRFTGADGAVGEFVFAAPLHQPGDRTILGKRYPQAGEQQAQAVLSDLALHPATATHLCTKLARHFAGDTPPPALVAKMQAAYLKSGGDLPSVYRVLIAAPEAWAPGTPKFKTPWEWTVSSLRALAVKDVQPAVVTGLMTQLGQPIWQPGSPAGYDDVAPSWAGPDAVLRRVEAAERFASRATQVDARVLAPKILPGAVSPATQTALANCESPAQALALLLVAPEFMRR